MNHTTNLNLPQWEETDRIQMDDFNEAMAAIDTAVAAAEEAANAQHFFFGTWTEDGNSQRIIDLPCTPKIALVFGRYQNNYDYLYILTQDKTCALNASNCIHDFSGFSLNGSRLVWTNANYSNYGSAVNHYVLIC